MTSRPVLPIRALRWGRNRIFDLYGHVPGWLFTATEGRRLRALKDTHAGQRCFIIGNGPSLKMHDLTRLAPEQKFATNMFVLHPDLAKIHLDFYCVSDPVHWIATGRFPQPCIEAFQKLPDCTFFFNKSYLPFHRWYRDVRNKRVYFVNLDERHHVWEGDFPVDITKYTSWGQVVIIDLCLPIAFYLGFKEVFLLGCDCDFGHSQTGDELKNHYFYDAGKDNRPLSTIHEDEWFDAVISSFTVVKQVFEADGRQIYNAGYGGKLEVFERVKYDDLF